MTELELEIRGRTADYALGRISRRAFQNWFQPTVWTIAEGEAELRTLAFTITRLLAE